MFAVNFVDSITRDEFWGAGDTVQEAWENMLADNDLVEDEVDLEMVTFFKSTDVTRQTKVTWEESDSQW